MTSFRFLSKDKFVDNFWVVRVFEIFDKNIAGK